MEPGRAVSNIPTQGPKKEGYRSPTTQVAPALRVHFRRPSDGDLPFTSDDRPALESIWQTYRVARKWQGSSKAYWQHLFQKCLCGQASSKSMMTQSPTPHLAAGHLQEATQVQQFWNLGSCCTAFEAAKTCPNRMQADEQVHQHRQRKP